MAERLSRWGADNAESWARSELSESIAQTARYMFLHALWDNLEGTLDATVAELRATVPLDDAATTRVEQILASSLYSFGFNVTYLLDSADGMRSDDGTPAYVDTDGPRWRLMETAPDGSLSGRDVGGLHESMKETVPGGEEHAHERGWF
jgi:hypothetical protein